MRIYIIFSNVHANVCAGACLPVADRIDSRKRERALPAQHAMIEAHQRMKQVLNGTWPGGYEITSNTGVWSRK